jgi:hypothetical protein
LDFTCPGPAALWLPCVRLLAHSTIWPGDCVRIAGARSCCCHYGRWSFGRDCVCDQGAIMAGWCYHQHDCRLPATCTSDWNLHLSMVKCWRSGYDNYPIILNHPRQSPAQVAACGQAQLHPPGQRDRLRLRPGLAPFQRERRRLLGRLSVPCQFTSAGSDYLPSQLNRAPEHSQTVR